MIYLIEAMVWRLKQPKASPAPYEPAKIPSAYDRLCVFGSADIL